MLQTICYYFQATSYHNQDQYSPDGLEEYLVDGTIDLRKHSQGWQFLVHWVGYGPEHNQWIASSELDDCEALDEWYRFGGDSPDS